MELTDFDVELNSATKTTDEILRTNLKMCPVCLSGDLVATAREKDKIIIYGLRGARVALHEEHRCNNKNRVNPCRAGAYHGYITYEGNKIYMPDCLKNDVFVVSNQTAFDMDYVIEIVTDVNILSACFDGIARKFNRLKNRHLPSATLERRVEICRKRVADAFYLFSYLEYSQRYSKDRWQVILEGDLEKTIMEHKDELHLKFRERWTIGHSCDVPGCDWCVIIDVDLKPHQMLCAAQLSGVREFEDADVRVVTGRAEMPGQKQVLLPPPT